MQIGWVDFSKQEREKVLDVINLLSEEGAVDELGIGIIRDGFANIFFPGTSTVQTRAKYFFIVPYILKEIDDGAYGNNPDKILEKIDEEEKKCAIKLLEKDRVGVIGARVLPKKWVARKPSNIYWSGIRRLKIFNEDSLSIPEYVKLSCSLRNQKDGIKLGNRNDEADENDKDDKDAGDLSIFHFWNLPDTYKNNWRENLTINLLKDEAVFLRNQIEKEASDSLFAFLLKNNIDVDKYTSFNTLEEDLREMVPERMKHDMRLACEFNDFVYLARIRYNIILSACENKEAVSEWDRLKDNALNLADIDLDAIFQRLEIKNFSLKRFLTRLKEAFMIENLEAADQIIKAREIELKGKERSKLNRVGEFNKDAWVGGKLLDFRFSDARNLINDIYQGEADASVKN